MKQQFRPQRLFDGQEFINNPVVSVEDGIVTAIEPDYSSSTATNLTGLLAPGFIDTQVNGGGGLLFNNEPKLSTLVTMSLAHSQFGSTGMMPTLITDNIQVMAQAADAVSAAIKQSVPGILGVHFEGPHLSTPKKGVHPAEHIREISAAEWAIFERQDLGVKMITLAPEKVSTESIARLKSLGWIVCLGHSNASYQQTLDALAAGANGFTHLFNAMSALTSREPGMVGAALMDDDAYCGIIIDHHHLHPATAQMAYRLKTAQKLVLVTDAMALVGSEQTQFNLFGEEILLQQDKLTISTGQLAGSHLSMQQAVKNAVEDLKIPLGEVLNMASLTPAQWLKTPSLGKITLGSQANWVLLDNDLTVRETWFNGQTRSQSFQPWSAQHS